MAGTHDNSELSLTGRRWVWPAPLAADATASVSLPAWVGAILNRRGIVEPDDVERYLSPSLATLDDPMQMADMRRAVARVLDAITKGEPITIYGDYDVDGVASTTVLVEFLTRVGARVDYYLPHRTREGYGLNADAVRKLASKTKVLITVDCGITAHDEIALAQSRGVDVIVVDHHRVPDVLPPAVANLNPHRPDCQYPFKDLCAAGVAFMFAVAMRAALRERGAFTDEPEPDLREMLDIVALATVADMVPLQGTNRTLVAAGVRRMATTRRTGMRALLEVSLADPSAVTATDLGFRLGPRINARGRISHAGTAVELLLTPDAARARSLAAALDAANRKRREIEQQTVDAAVAKVENEGLDKNAALVVFDPSWHPGVLGLVATRLVSRFHRPAIVIGDGGKGSGRSIEGLDLHDSIEATSQHLLRFGGHTAAAGVTVAPDRVEAFREAFAGEVERRIGAPPFVPVLRPELEVEPGTLSLDMLAQLDRLEPFGQANPEPLLVARRLSVRNKRVVGQRHLKLKLGDAGLDAIGFGLGDVADEVPETVDVAFRLSRNRYRGRDSLQLKVEDLRHLSELQQPVGGQ
ncbi:MAG: single-stranded-DNA-specific exonuclease RecJ, partial [Myxococcota bacterium]